MNHKSHLGIYNGETLVCKFFSVGGGRQLRQDDIRPPGGELPRHTCVTPVSSSFSKIVGIGVAHARTVCGSPSRLQGLRRRCFRPELTRPSPIGKLAARPLRFRGVIVQVRLVEASSVQKVCTRSTRVSQYVWL